jgi:hypothetical protein
MTDLEPCCLATTLGSLPHTDVARGTDLIFAHTPQIPTWAQFPKRALRENMILQFTEGLPGIVVTESGRAFFDTTSSGFVDEVIAFYGSYLAAIEEHDPAALDTFGLSAEYAAGFGEFVTRLPGAAHPFALKGQVTGPFTLGTSLLDQDRRCAYYDEQLRDVIVKSVALKATWQIARLRPFCERVMVFADEPALLGYGSQTFLAVSREDILGDLNAVAGAIHAAGGLAGVHCEENTDWSLLMESDLDILDFDAYAHIQVITLYPAELRAFLVRGGWLAWGIVPTLDPRAAATETIPSLLTRFDAGVDALVRKGFDREFLLRRSLITPSCGAGGVLDVPLAERVLKLLQELSLTLRQREFAECVI